MATQGSSLPEPDADALIARARATRVIVVGGGMAGLTAAWECAKVGMSVTVLEAREQLGGAVRRIEVDGLEVDTASDSFATMGGHVQRLVDELDLGEDVVSPAPIGPWIAGIPDSSAQPMPQGGLFGLPENPFQDDVRRVIGGRGAWRAYVDRLRPPMTIGHERSLGRLVATRMGQRVRDRLLAPNVTGMYSVDVADIDADAMIPGLNAALTRTGSLSGAVSQVLATLQEKASGPPVAGLRGGNGRLVDALRAELDMLGAVVRTGTAVRALDQEGPLWHVDIDAPRESVDEEDSSAEDALERLTAEAVIVAVDETSARELLAPIAVGWGEAVPGAAIETVTMVLEPHALDPATRGSGVLTVPRSRPASGLTIATVKWPWLGDVAGGRHVVRVMFGPEAGVPATEGLDDAAAVELARHEAAELLGIELPFSAIRDARRERFAHAQPAVFLGAAQRRAEHRKAIARVPGLGVVGAWIAGAGLVSVVPDARAEADRIRRALLWD